MATEDDHESAAAPRYWPVTLMFCPLTMLAHRTIWFCSNLVTSAESISFDSSPAVRKLATTRSSCSTSLIALYYLAITPLGTPAGANTAYADDASKSP